MKENVKSLEKSIKLENNLIDFAEFNSKENQKFISQVSHNQKNPFATLLGFLDLLEEDLFELTDEEKIYYISEIKKSAKLSYKYNERFFEWLYFRSGKIELNFENLNLHEIITETINSLPAVQLEKCMIENNIDTNILIYSDEDTIQKAIYYLIENAVQYSDFNQIVKIEAVDLPEKVLIKIIDKGIGISANDVELLFDYNQNSNIISLSKEKGTGLSLILAKLFVEANGGRIGVRSNLGVGSTFYIELPNNN